jgi:hypothetical protein
MATTFNTANWNKKTPKFWRILGIVCLVGVPVTDLVLGQSGLPIEVKPWIMFAKDIFLVGIKMTTKLFYNETDTSKPTD